ncbi:MAG: haloperoxidase, partial [Flavobacteriales bacterium]|nr:haloperoxidase [Flavobacteriales bacterium]
MERGAANVAYIWGGVALEATANDTENNKPRPTVNSRMLALPMVAQFDAWSRYDSLAVPVFLKAERRPVAEHTEANKEEAISYAMARALTSVYPADSQLFADQLTALGYDPG